MIGSGGKGVGVKGVGQRSRLIHLRRLRQSQIGLRRGAVGQVVVGRRVLDHILAGLAAYHGKLLVVAVIVPCRLQNPQGTGDLGGLVAGLVVLGVVAAAAGHKGQGHHSGQHQGKKLFH